MERRWFYAVDLTFSPPFRWVRLEGAVLTENRTWRTDLVISTPKAVSCYHGFDIQTEEESMKAISDSGRLNRRTLLARTWLVFLAGWLGWRLKASGAPSSGPEFLSEPRVAREWRGKVIGTRVAEYQKYLFDQGIVKLSQIEGNLGVQMFRIEDGEA